jgi:acetyl-CoA C-acetyltransferase
VIKAVVQRNGIDPALVDDVILGCTDTLGPQAGNIARTAWLAAGFPHHVPGVTVDRLRVKPASAALRRAGRVVRDDGSGAGRRGAEHEPDPDQRRDGRRAGLRRRRSVHWQERYGSVEVSQFRSADMIAGNWDISREAMEEFATEVTSARSPRSTRAGSTPRPCRSRISATTRGPGETRAFSGWPR